MSASEIVPLVWRVKRKATSVVKFYFDPAKATASYTLVLTVRKLDADRTSVFSITLTAVNVAAGEYSVTLTATQTNIDEGEYTFDVWRTDSGSERQLAHGTLIVEPQVKENL